MSYRQPDFLIIGANNSATTWLQRNLQQHSTVFMPGREPHYFSRHFERSPAWYASLFEPAKPHQLLGEKSNSYLDHPATPQRLRAALPNARLIIQLRNPVDRAYSDYCRHYRAGRIGADINDYLGGDGPEAERMRSAGLYYRHITRFLELFPREQLCITLYEDLDSEPAGVLSRIRGHIGLTETGQRDAGVMKLRVKDKSTPVVPLRARRVLAPFRLLAEPFREAPWFRATRGMIARKVVYPELSHGLRERLLAYYKDDVGELSELLGRDLSPWTELNTAAA